MSYRIIADSGCDLPLEFFQDNDVTLLPLKVIIDDKEYDDRLSIEPKEVYDIIRKGEMPKTSQVSPEKFEELFRKMAEAKESGVYIAFSSELSGTYNTAVMIRDQIKEEYEDFDLTIIDSKCASLGCGLVVMEAARLAKKGTPKKELIERLKFHCKHMEHLFTVEDLNHLVRGGRVSKASAFLGSLLNIKPLLNVEDGKLIPLEKVRGHKKLLRRIIDLMKERGTQFDKQPVGISHADCLQYAQEIKEMIIEEFGVKEVIITQVGATIGSHTGPGTIAVFFLNELLEE